MSAVQTKLKLLYYSYSCPCMSYVLLTTKLCSSIIITKLILVPYLSYTTYVLYTYSEDILPLPIVLTATLLSMLVIPLPLATVYYYPNETLYQVGLYSTPTKKLTSTYPMLYSCQLKLSLPTSIRNYQTATLYLSLYLC